MAEKKKSSFFQKLIGGKDSSESTTEKKRVGETASGRPAAKKTRIGETASGRPAPVKKLKLKKVHKLEKGQTLSHLSLKYYGSATEPYWRLILDFNEDLDNERNIWPGLEIKIPELPADMKKK